jgi:hypothetical protein
MKLYKIEPIIPNVVNTSIRTIISIQIPKKNVIYMNLRLSQQQKAFLNIFIIHVNRVIIGEKIRHIANVIKINKII